MNIRSHILHAAIIVFALLAVFVPSATTTLLILTILAAAAAYANAMFLQPKATAHAPQVTSDVNATVQSLGSTQTNDGPGANSELMESIRQLGENLSQGDLTARLSKAVGIDDAPGNALNEALTTLNSAVDEALALADVASDGDLSARASGTYSGHSAALTKALNGLLDGLHKLVTTLVDAVGHNDERSRKMASVASDLSERSRDQKSSIEEIDHNVTEIRNGLNDISSRAEASRVAMDGTVEASGLGRQRITQAVTAIERVEAGSKEIAKVVELITSISQQSQLLSINALVESARAGAAGRGFGYVAKEVGVLATRTTEAAQKIAEIAQKSTEDIEAGSRLVNATVGTIDQIDDNASRANEASNEILAATRAEFDRVTNVQSRLSETRSGADANLQLAEMASQVATELSESAEELREVTERFILNDDEMAQHVISRADQASKALANAVARGEISMDDLFSKEYQEIKGSNPLQYMTAYVAVTDKYLQSIIESVFDIGPGVAFGAIMNSDGFLPTHSVKFSKPQGADPVWNAANSRNRRFFNDRVGLACGQSLSNHLVQVYRRDMGGGRFTTMKDISAPIAVKGRHWGGFRIGYRSSSTERVSQKQASVSSGGGVTGLSSSGQMQNGVAANRS